MKLKIIEIDERKDVLLKHIEMAPGIRYRELLRLTGLANGVLFYHLSDLEESGLIQVMRKQAKTTRYFPSNIPEGESTVLSCLRQEPLRQIIMFLLEHDTCSADEIARHTGKARSTISNHLKHLQEEKLVSVSKKELRLSYELKNMGLVAEVMSKYRDSFLDRAVDNLLGMVGEL